VLGAGAVHFTLPKTFDAQSIALIALDGPLAIRSIKSGHRRSG